VCGDVEIATEKMMTEVERGGDTLLRGAYEGVVSTLP